MLVVAAMACGGSDAANEEGGPDGLGEDDGGITRREDSGTKRFTPPKSCTGGPGADTACGENGADCCDVKTLPGGSYNRFNDDRFPARVSTFALDTFEVTGGRFRAWVEATDGDLRSSAPPEGGGAHPKIDGSGWRSEWNEMLPTTRAEVDRMLGPEETDGAIRACQYGTNIDDSGALTWWTEQLDRRVKDKNKGKATVLAENTKEALDRKPLNCIPWHVLFAFCVWDGGRLPTDAEFGFAYAGGSEQRPFPWGTVEESGLVHLANRKDLSRVPVFDPFAEYVSARLYDETVGPNVFEDNYSFTYGGKFMAKTDNATHIAPVGKKPLGNGKWGHADLGGGMFEWMLDEGPIREGECNDCANVAWPAKDEKDPDARTDQPEFQNAGGHDWFVGGARSVRGSAWDNSVGLATRQTTEEISYYTSYPVGRTYRALGGRCARDLK